MRFQLLVWGEESERSFQWLFDDFLFKALLNHDTRSLTQRLMECFWQTPSPLEHVLKVEARTVFEFWEEGFQHSVAEERSDVLANLTKKAVATTPSGAGCPGRMCLL